VTDLDLAEAAAHEAGRLLMSRFGGPAEAVAEKSSPTDMVSEADRAAERLVVERLRVARPNDGVLGEEGAAVDGASGRRWLVDPLDGTTNYLYGHPSWAVSIALEDADGLRLGVVHAPVLRETYTAERGAGARLGGEPIRVRQPVDLAQALVGTGFGYAAELRAAQAELLRGALPRLRDIRRGGSAALDLAWVAAGRLDGYWERGLSPWDLAAGSLLVTEAGGALAPLDGEPPGLAAASPSLLPALVELVGRW
jgi:myo-inositol-1(or 4)-monophosphatase